MKEHERAREIGERLGEMDEFKRSVYQHGGSRIWRERPDGTRDLLADTYQQGDSDKVFALFSGEDARQLALQGLAEALRVLYEETIDYITVNHLGDPHHNQSMQKARAALAAAKPFLESK